ncbi:bifunctional metallophosphatase/5'-nucleotidase [Steroidobacter sp. S1-65]|uniref:Bifunctional metallophosphatase/5'-nucleotidase n=1 Tax=Steroidobacter gossypii TaxID=2805490 RepID=A0ABS1WWL8_9GAMM|nr:bifunctional metallophosphatase/5'-nucleotidase [Steroidobacter gossypii]MBM0105357.1 bifunctional metallophosphatase/5'-nucleotidase [Steroidobacter gossypii]
MRSRSMWLAVAVATTFSVAAHSHNQYSHSNEADRFEERLEGREARAKAAQRLTWRDSRWKYDPVVKIKLLGINDFHGQLSPRTVGSRPAGGAAVLASYLRAASESAKDGAIIVHAGDHVGASPPNSALLQDEPAISVLNQLANKHCLPVRLFRKLPHDVQAHTQPRCNIIGTFGNHEFDEGIDEALRLVYGGNHEQGPFIEERWQGARFPYISANVIDERTGRSVLPPHTVKLVDGVRIGFIGAVLKETPSIVTPTGVAGLEFIDEADAINASVKQLKRQGVKTIVVTIHQGTGQTSYTGPTDPEVAPPAGPIAEIVKRLDSEVDVVISGHAHGFTNALVANTKGKQILLTQAFSASTAYGDIDLSISRKSADVVEKSAAIVTTWGDEGPGLVPDVKMAQLVAQADERVAPLVNRVVGTVTTALTRTESSAGESSLGNLIADAQRVTTNADFAFMNPGGIRADLAAGEVTWGDLFTIQPFGNDLVSMDLTGAQIKTLLEQQWQGQTFPRILKTSGLTYTWDNARPVGDRVTQILTAEATPLEPTAIYRVTVNSFIAAGGDNFLVLPEGTNRVVGPVDLDALVEYVESLPQPFNAAIEGRITRTN